MAKNGKKKDAPHDVAVLPATEIALGEILQPKRSFRMIQVVQNVNMSKTFDGLAMVLKQTSGLEYKDIDFGELVLFINNKRNYIKLVVGCLSQNPVIASYRLPSGMTLPAQAIKRFAESVLRRGELQADERLRTAIGETLEEAKARLVSGT